MLPGVGQRNRVLDGLQISKREGECNFDGEKGPARTYLAVDIVKATQQGQNRYSANSDWGVLDGGAHWHNLANTIEPSVCGGDTALCQTGNTFCGMWCMPHS